MIMEEKSFLDIWSIVFRSLQNTGIEVFGQNIAIFDVVAQPYIKIMYLKLKKMHLMISYLSD